MERREDGWHYTPFGYLMLQGIFADYAFNSLN